MKYLLWFLVIAGIGCQNPTSVTNNSSTSDLINPGENWVAGNKLNQCYNFVHPELINGRWVEIVDVDACNNAAGEETTDQVTDNSLDEVENTAEMEINLDLPEEKLVPLRQY